MQNDSPTATPFRVFVYGTLMPGERYYRVICAGRTTAEIPAKIRARLYHLPEPRNYPGIVEGDDWVLGWILEFNDHALMLALDELEDYDPDRPASANEYSKLQVQTYSREGNPIALADAYFMSEQRIADYRGKPITGRLWQEDPPRN